MSTGGQGYLLASDQVESHSRQQEYKLRNCCQHKLSWSMVRWASTSVGRSQNN